MGNQILAGLANLKSALIKRLISKNTSKASSFTQYRQIALEKNAATTTEKNAIRNNETPQFDGDMREFRIKKQYKQRRNGY